MATVREDLIHELTLLIRSRYGLIHLQSADEDRAAQWIKQLADGMRLPLFTWSLTGGLRREGEPRPIYGTENAGTALEHLCLSDFNAIYHFRGLGPLLAEDRLLRARLADAARAFSRREGALVLSGSQVALDEDLALHGVTCTPPAPSADDYAALLGAVYRDLSARMDIRVELDRADRDRLVRSLQGLTLAEAEKVLTRAMVEDGTLSPDDLEQVFDAKRRIIEREGLLEYTPAERNLADVAGLDNLKRWLQTRTAIMHDPVAARDHGLPFPRGILLLGVPGAGKSLCARAVAGQWQLPLLKMDPSGLYNKYIGETEKNFRRAMQTAERVAPVVLWIDEIEKAFASGGSEDGGVSQRVLGIFLSWMQERAGDVFVVATANDVAKLPPEMLRKGRFDEIFFVDLPDAPTREAIFRLHLSRRGHDPAVFDLEALSAATEGFSGAEIEQVLISALYQSFADGTTLATDTLLDEARATVPLSRTRSEELTGLRQWARSRAVNAGATGDSE